MSNRTSFCESNLYAGASLKFFLKLLYEHTTILIRLQAVNLIGQEG